MSNSISTLNSSADYSSRQRRNPHTQQIKWRDAVHDEIVCAVDDCWAGGREKGQNMAIGGGGGNGVGTGRQESLRIPVTTKSFRGWHVWRRFGTAYITFLLPRVAFLRGKRLFRLKFPWLCSVLPYKQYARVALKWRKVSLIMSIHCLIGCVLSSAMLRAAPV